MSACTIWNLSIMNNIIEISISDIGWNSRKGRIYIMTSKQRAYLKGLAMTMDPIINVGKSSVTPELITSVDEAIEKRELIKISILKNCLDDPKIIAQTIAERTKSQVVQVIGKKIVLYRMNKKKPKIELPK